MPLAKKEVSMHSLSLHVLPPPYPPRTPHPPVPFTHTLRGFLGADVREEKGQQVPSRTRSGWWWWTCADAWAHVCGGRHDPSPTFLPRVRLLGQLGSPLRSARVLQSGSLPRGHGRRVPGCGSIWAHGVRPAAQGTRLRSLEPQKRECSPPPQRPRRGSRHVGAREGGHWPGLFFSFSFWRGLFSSPKGGGRGPWGKGRLASVVQYCHQA